MCRLVPRCRRDCRHRSSSDYRSRSKFRAAGDAAGLGDRPVDGSADHRGVVRAVDRDGHQLPGAVDRDGGERVCQGLTGIERLHRGVAVVERVGPDLAAVSAYSCRRRWKSARTAAQASFGLSTSVEFRSPVAVGVPDVPLATPPASWLRLQSRSLVMTAASFALVDGDRHRLAARCRRPL